MHLLLHALRCAGQAGLSTHISKQVFKFILQSQGSKSAASQVLRHNTRDLRATSRNKSRTAHQRSSAARAAHAVLGPDAGTKLVQHTPAALLPAACAACANQGMLHTSSPSGNSGSICCCNSINVTRSAGNDRLWCAGCSAGSAIWVAEDTHCAETLLTVQAQQ